VVTLNGRDYYLGAFGSLASKDAYDRLIAEWLGNGRVETEVLGESQTSVNDLILAYIRRGESYYRLPTGDVSNQLVMIKLACRVLRKLYGDTDASTFGPMKLKAVQAAFVQSGLARSECNRRTGLIKGLFKWGCSEELVPPSVYHGLSCVEGLQRGRSKARETDPIKPVETSQVEAIMELVPANVRAMIAVQRLTGARPGEIVGMRIGEIDRSGDVWVYRPKHHKTSHHGKARAIVFGPRAQAILAPLLAGDPRKPVFPTRNGGPYHIHSYRDAIHRGCDRAGIDRWNPNQLRHALASEIRREAGLEAAQVILGHANADVTQVYAERDESLARRTILRFG
jgi:integrase